MIEALPKLEAWHDFYVMTGSGAAALTGLLFVIVSLGPRVVAKNVETGVRAFITPIAVHFTTAMTMSAAMLAPEVPSIVLGGSFVIGGIGLAVYSLWTRSMALWRRSKLPILDWIWYIGLPFAAFGLITASGFAIAANVALGLYALGTATVLLIVIGIRNAWDIVVWMTMKSHDGGS